MKKFSSILISIILLLTLFSSCSKPIEKMSATELLDLGEKYLSEMNYEQAVVYFGRLIEVEPKNPRGYTGLAETYIAMGDTEKAIEIMEDGLILLPDDAALRSLLDEVLPPESAPPPTPLSESTPEPVPEPAPTTPSIEGAIVESELSVSDFSYSFTWENNWGTNDGAIGGCYLYCTVTGNTEDIYNILISTWGDSLTDDMIRNNADMLLPLLKESGVGGHFEGKINGVGFPLRQENLGKSLQVALIAFNKDYEYLGKIVVEVQVPANPA